eukprot:SAG25_NODE_266_length_10666_cov_14.508943_14_plen_252_part_00
MLGWSITVELANTRVHPRTRAGVERGAGGVYGRPAGCGVGVGVQRRSRQQQHAVSHQFAAISREDTPGHSEEATPQAYSVLEYAYTVRTALLDLVATSLLVLAVSEYMGYSSARRLASYDHQNDCGRPDWQRQRPEQVIKSGRNWVLATGVLAAHGWVGRAGWPLLGGGGRKPGYDTYLSRCHSPHRLHRRLAQQQHHIPRLPHARDREGYLYEVPRRRRRCQQRHVRACVFRVSVVCSLAPSACVPAVHV